MGASHSISVLPFVSAAAAISARLDAHEAQGCHAGFYDAAGYCTQSDDDFLAEIGGGVSERISDTFTDAARFFRQSVTNLEGAWSRRA